MFRTFFAKLGKRVYKRFRWLLSKGPTGIAAIALASIVVLFAGVGGTMAATGVFPTYLSSPSASATPSLSSSPTPSGNAGPAQTKDGDLPADIPSEGHLGADGLAKLQQSGWVGARLTFYHGGFQLIYSGLITNLTDNKITTRVSFNGGPGGGTNNCGPGKIGQTCPGSQSGSLVYSPNSTIYCLPGGDTYSVSVTGMGINFSESGYIPAGIIDCPAVDQPSGNQPQSPQQVPEQQAPPGPWNTPGYVPTVPTSEPSWPSPSAVLPPPTLG